MSENPTFYGVFQVAVRNQNATFKNLFVFFDFVLHNQPMILTVRSSLTETQTTQRGNTMFELEFTKIDGSKTYDFSQMEGTVEEVQKHYEYLIQCGQSGHPFIGRNYAGYKQVKVIQA